MSLTVREKDHWKERIGRRIDKKIEVIGAEDPSLFKRVERDARQRALDSLGLAEMQAELDSVQREKESLDKRTTQVGKAMLAHIRGVPVEDFNGYHHNREIADAIKNRQRVHEDELLTENELGQQILRLRSEKDELIDVVWLATSPKQIKELWSKVAGLLGDSQTHLEREAMTIEAVSNE